ncbi:sensor histidine kinase [Acidobacteriota bacterium]
MDMESRAYKKKIFLFILVFVLPCIVLVLLSLRMISQEKELSQKRAQDDSRRTATEIGQRLLIRLENIKRLELINPPESAGYTSPETVFVGRIMEGNLELPWEVPTVSDSEIRSLNQPDFLRRIERAENAEFVLQNNSQAVSFYNQALNSASTKTQQGFSRLLLARTLVKASQKESALSQYKILLFFPFDVSDEFGIPFFLYAARQLTENSVSFEDCLKRLRESLGDSRWIPPPESYMMQDICQKILEKTNDSDIIQNAQSVSDGIKDNLQKLDRLQSLKREFAGIALNLRGGIQTPLWTAYQDQEWLISLAPAIGEGPETLFVINAANILSAPAGSESDPWIAPNEIRIIPDDSPDGEYLGPSFPGMKVTWSDTSDKSSSGGWAAQRLFYILALFVVIGVTLFGAYLLWRDMRRELQLAEIRSQFVSSVSHELKTPLTSIRMFAETLRLGRSKDIATQNEYLDTIVNESQRLTRLLNNVLDFSKITKGKRTYRKEYASLHEILEGVARTMDYQLSQQGFELHLELEENIPEIRVDRDAMEQAVLNLLSNAMKYSGDSRDITLSFLREEDFVVIQVIDKGIGIDPREHDRIFEKYYRIESPENVRSTGTGLGLALVSHIVQAHGGHVDVESNYGEGSTFSVFLPLEVEE